MTSVSNDPVSKTPSIPSSLPSTSSKISFNNPLLSPQATDNNILTSPQSSSPPNNNSINNFQPFSPVKTPSNQPTSTPTNVRLPSIEKEPMLTGNPKADEEIMKFYRLRQATAAINNNQQVKQ